MSKWILLFAVSVSGSLAGVSPKASAAGPDRANGTQVSGYIDVQHQWGRGSLDLNSTAKMPGESTGFVVNQGAMMLNHEFETAEAVVDIPFRSHTTNGTDSNELELATWEAQAYIKNQYDSGLYWQLGQFDGIFGTEPNDTVEILFPRHGILHGFTPTTNTGLQLGFTFLPFTVQLMAANGNSTTRQNPDLGMEYAIRLGWNQEPVNFGIGASYTENHGTYPLATLGPQDYRPRMLFNGMVSAQLGKFDVAGELNLAQSRLGDVETASAGHDKHDLVMAYLVQVLFKFTDKWAAGLRYEYIKNDETSRFVQAAQPDPTLPGATTLTGQGGYVSKLSFGVKKAMSEKLTAKAGIDVMNLNIGVDGPSKGKSNNWIEGAVAAVYDF
jgi:hypothetical protein